MKQIASRLTYENRWMRVREDTVERTDGSTGSYGVIEKPDFALIIPRAEDGGLWLVEQYRYPVERRLWEFPQGSWEEQSIVDPAVLARGELQEETGLRAGDLRHIGHLYLAASFCTQGFDVWLATELEQGAADRGIEEQDMRVRKVSRLEWEMMVSSGEVKSSASLAAYGLLQVKENGGT
jgi:8-oxo-dGTP pyrophosphatase MutT (NUDIX family)